MTNKTLDIYFTVQNSILLRIQAYFLTVLPNSQNMERIFQCRTIRQVVQSNPDELKHLCNHFNEDFKPSLEV